MAPRPILAFVSFVAVAAAAGPPAAQEAAQVERGRYLAYAGDCVSCHTAKDGKPYAGGRPLIAPQGVIYSTNITSDAETGIGGWSAEQFYDALHFGRGRPGHLYPAMPYNYFTKMTRADSDDLFAFIRTLPPVTSTAHKNKLPFPYNIRPLLVFWNLLKLKTGEYAPDPSKSESWNRGAYLVEALGHCGGCHTPIDKLGAPKQDQFLQGNVTEDWFAPDLTADRRRGIGAWSRAEVVSYLKSGRNDRAAVAGPMAEVVRESTSHLTEEDLSGIADYLASVPASPEPPAAPALDPTLERHGRSLYVSNCGKCHGLSGAGQPGFYPALAGHNGVQQVNPLTSIRVILQGVHAPSVAGQQAMPAFARLDDREISEILTYIRGAWGNQAGPVSPGEIAAIRKRLAADRQDGSAP